jgi:hypothetical protein
MAAKKTARRRSTPAAVEVYERITALETLMASQVETSQSLAQSVSEIKASLQSYKGFWGAVTMVGGAVGACFALFKDNILHLFQK